MHELTVSYRVSFRKREGSALVVRKRSATAQGLARTVTLDLDGPSIGPPAEPHPTARLLALAYRIERMVAAGELRDYREAAARFGISHARMSQVTAMLLLAPAIQADILLGRVVTTEGGFRNACRFTSWDEQVALLVGPASAP